MIEANESWLHGKYDNGEINTSLPYVAVNEPEYFVQGEQASDVISEIHTIWTSEDITTEEAFNKWINIYL